MDEEDKAKLESLAEQETRINTLLQSKKQMQSLKEKYENKILQIASQLELLTVGEPDSSGDYYFAAFDLDGNELARSSQPVGSFNAVMMKRPNGYLLDTGYMWELYAPDGTFLEKSLPVGERETLCQLCGDFCTFDVFLPLEENAFLAVGHHGKATEPDEPVVFRITTDF